MYGKCFLVLFSLLLLVVSTFAENLHSLKEEALKQIKIKESCTERLLPVRDDSVFSHLVRETSCTK